MSRGGRRCFYLFIFIFIFYLHLLSSCCLPAAALLSAFLLSQSRSAGRSNHRRVAAVPVSSPLYLPLYLILSLLLLPAPLSLAAPPLLCSMLATLAFGESKTSPASGTSRARSNSALNTVTASLRSAFPPRTAPRGTVAATAIATGLGGGGVAVAAAYLLFPGAP